jgi:hypothetical protein
VSAAVEVFPDDPMITKQKASPVHAFQSVHNRSVIRCKHFHSPHVIPCRSPIYHYVDESTASSATDVMWCYIESPICVQQF